MSKFRGLHKSPWRDGWNGSKWRDVEYEAGFWVDPIGDGRRGKYETRRNTAVLTKRKDGKLLFDRVAPSVSFYNKLMGWAS